MSQFNATFGEGDLIEQIGEAAARIEKLAGIKNLMTELDDLAGSIGSHWAGGRQAPLMLRRQIDRLLARVSQEVPYQFHNGHSFLLPSLATARDAKQMLFNARMAAGVWMLAEWK